MTLEAVVASQDGNQQLQQQDQAAPAAEQQPAAPAAAPQEPPRYIDPDLAEAEAARKAAAEEEAARAAGAPPADSQQQPPAAAPVQQPQPEPQGDGQQAAPAVPQPTVPLARVRELSRALREARDEAAYQKGRAEALAAGAQPQQQAGAQPQQPQQPDFQQRISAERDRVKEAAEKFDKGEITYSALKDIEFAANDAIDGIRGEAFRAEQARATGQGEATGRSGFAWSDQAQLDRYQAELEAAHPYLTVMTDGALQHLKQRAYEDAAAAGRPFGAGAAETARLWHTMADLSDFYGPRWFPDTKFDARPQPSSGAQPPANGQQPPTTAQQRLGKLALADRMPPNTASMGGPGGQTVLSDSRLSAMSDDEIAALPASVKDSIRRGSQGYG